MLGNIGSFIYAAQLCCIWLVNVVPALGFAFYVKIMIAVCDHIM